jgi:hypothetical protein
MDFHCANRRKARRLHLAAVDYLGDVPSEPLLPMRPVYMPRYSARCFACRKTHRLLAGLGFAAIVILGGVHLMMTLSWS